MSTGGGGVVINSTGTSELEKNLQSGGNKLSGKSDAVQILGTTLKKTLQQKTLQRLIHQNVSTVESVLHVQLCRQCQLVV